MHTPFSFFLRLSIKPSFSEHIHITSLYISARNILILFHLGSQMQGTDCPEIHSCRSLSYRPSYIATVIIQSKRQVIIRQDPKIRGQKPHDVCIYKPRRSSLGAILANVIAPLRNISRSHTSNNIDVSNRNPTATN